MVDLIICQVCGCQHEIAPGAIHYCRGSQGQTRKHSFYEVCCSTAFGYVIALLTQYLVFPLFNIQTSHQDNILIALIFTVVSIIRSYIFRRIFNRFVK